MRKYISLIITLHFAFGITIAQQDLINLNPMDPFSKYGIGTPAEELNSQSMAMGGISQSITSPYYLNYSNPASYGSVDTLSFLFNFSVQYQHSKTRLNNDTLKLDSYNFSGFGLKFPIIKNLGASIGLRPYTSVSYDNAWIQTLDDSSSVYNIENGKGGISNFYGGLGYNINKYVQIGFNASYLFGEITHYNRVNLGSNTNSSLLETQNETYVNSFKFSYGIMGHVPIKDNKINFGATYHNQSNLSGSEVTTTTLTQPNDSPEIVDSTENDVILVLPQSLAFGLSYEIKDKLIIGADYSFTNWSEGTYVSSTNALINSSRISFGAEYIPNAENRSSWLKRTKYRLGGHIYNMPIEINDNPVQEIGINFGVGVPMRRSKSTMNIAAELGRRGNYDQNLVEENYVKILVSLSLFDHWFYKRKID